MKVLVLSAFYPTPDGTHERMFVHVRDKYYLAQGIDITVLNFAYSHDYEIDGIKVISLQSYKAQQGQYDIVVSHASNLRNHYRFLKKYEERFPHIVFFFHGHEMMYLTKDYPRPYHYDKAGRLYRRVGQNIYDKLKISLWRKFYKELSAKSDFVFVSNWLLERFKENTDLTESDLNNQCHIINNSVGEVFEKESYDWKAEKRYDFITIRSNLDGSTYCIDLLVELAKRYPAKRFLLIGKGRFFEHNEQPQNLEWISHPLSHEEMLNYINSSRCALMLTRHDTQGVMTCELATYGIPVITSDIEVCYEFFDWIPNVRMISNDVSSVDLEHVVKQLEESGPYDKVETLFAKNTTQKEVELFNSIVKCYK